MALFPPTLHLWRGTAGCPCVLARARPAPAAGVEAMRAGWPARACHRGRAGWPRLSVRPCTPLAVTAPRFSPVCALLLAELFYFLTDISV